MDQITETSAALSKKKWSGGRLLVLGILMVVISRILPTGLIGDLLIVFGAVIAFGGATQVNWRRSVFEKEQ